MTTTELTLTNASNTVTFTRRGDRAVMKNSLGETALMTQEEAIARVHTLIDAGWRLAA